MKLSVIIPCYNEEDNIELLYKTIEKTLKTIKDYELIFVDDGSKDKTLEILKTISKKEKENIKIVSFSRNFGKEAAMYAGLKEVKGKYAVIIDADLQQNPKVILEMYDILEKNKEYDVVAAYQNERKENKIVGLLKKIFYKFINKISEVDFVSDASDFRMFRNNVVKSILELKEKNRFSKGIFSWIGYNTYYIPYEVEKRNAGVSKWSVKNLFKYAIDGILSFSISPLYLPLYLGIIMILVSIITLIVILIVVAINSYKITNFIYIIIFINFIGGLIITNIGILALYFSKIYTEIKNRPVYIEKEIISNKD